MNCIHEISYKQLGRKIIVFAAIFGSKNWFSDVKLHLVDFESRKLSRAPQSGNKIISPENQMKLVSCLVVYKPAEVSTSRKYVIVI